MSAGANKASHHLMTCLAVLIILMMALLTAVILMKSGDQLPIPEKLRNAPRVESSRPPVFESQEESMLDSTASKPTRTTTRPRSICKSPECIHLAHQLHNFRDPSVDPCQDFYKATCGKYSEHTVFNDAELARKGTIVNQLIKEFLLRNESTTSKSENAMHLMYSTCKKFHNSDNEEIHINEYRKQAFETIQSIGSFPLLQTNWSESDFDLNETLENMAKHGFSQFGFFGMNSFGNPGLVVMPFESPLLKYGPKRLAAHFHGVFKKGSFESDKDLLEKDTKSFVVLDKELAELFTVQSNEIVGIDELQKHIPSIDFKRIIQGFMKSDDIEEMWTKVHKNILSEKYDLFFGQFKSLETILKTTPNRTLANYLMFQLIMKITVASPEDCSQVVMDNLSSAALRVFVRNHFDKENLKIASDMIDELKNGFIDIIRNSEWLHEDTRKFAIEKIEMMEKTVGYPEEMEEPGALDETFESLDISATDSYFAIISKIRRFNMEQTLDFVGGSKSILSAKRVLTSNASYFKNYNWIYVLVPILADPMFDSTYPSYAKIAGVGGIIGHEIGHGFDPEGRKFHVKGKYFDWWTPEDSTEYERRIKCLSDQYSNYDDPVYGKNLNGSTTIKEIVADNIGMNMAWQTYKNSDMSDELGIVGFEDFSLDKLFFHISSLKWCSPHRTIPLKLQQTIKHPTSTFRVNGVFSNMKSFAETFNCPVGSPMNPEKKCEML